MLDTFLAISIALYVVIAVAAVCYAMLVRKAGVLDPLIQFIGFLSLFSLPLPVRVLISKEIEGDVTEYLPVLLPYMPVAVALTALSLPLFVWAYYSPTAAALGRRLPRPPSRQGRGAYFAFAVVGTICLLLLGELARESGGILGFFLLGYNLGTGEMVGKGYLAAGIPWFFVASLFLLYRYANRRRRFDLFLFCMVMLLQVVAYFLLGDRHSLLYIGMALVIFVHHAIRPVRFKTLVITGLLLFVALNIMGYLRGTDYSSLADVLTRTSRTISSEDSESKTAVYSLTTGEFVVPFETFPQMIRDVGTAMDAQYGLTYLNALTFFIPSALFPDRPLPLSNWYMQTYYGKGWGLHEGRAFFFLAEGYLNLGPAGVFLTMLVWGLFLGAVRSYIEAANNEPGAVMLYALTLAWIFRGIAGESGTMIVGLPEQSLLAAILGLLLATHFRAWHCKAPATAPAS